VPDEWEHLRDKLEQCQNQSEKKIVRRQMFNTEDVKPGKSGIVRDRWLREQIRQCLRDNKLNPDNFSKAEIKKMIEKGNFIVNGVPVRRIRILWTLNEVKVVPRKKYNPATAKKEYLPLIKDKDKKSNRVYQTRNNHHIEIREDDKGKWSGNVITNFNAAMRLKPSKASGVKPSSAVDRDNNSKDGKFVMSLSIGEMVKMKHPKTKEPGYFVVFKIDSSKTIHFTQHNDAGRAKETEKTQKREDISTSPAQLKLLGIEDNKPPVKIYISPLGEVKELLGD
jgi:hypothetical protein